MIETHQQDTRDILRGALASLGGFGGRMVARFILMLVAGHLYGAASLGVLGQVAALVEILGAVAILGNRRSLLERLSAVKLGKMPAGAASPLDAPDAPDMQSDGTASKGPNLGPALQVTRVNMTEESVIKASLLSTLILSSFMTVILALVWPLLFPAHAFPPLMLLAVPAIAFTEVAGAAIRFKRLIRWDIIARCVAEPWSFLGTALALYYSGLEHTGLLAAYAVSMVAASSVIVAGFVRAYSIAQIWQADVSRQDVWRASWASLPYGITDLGVLMVRRVDILLLSIFTGHEVTGFYYMAQQIVTVPHKIYQLFEPMSVAVFADLHHNGKRQEAGQRLAALCRWVFLLQISITVPFVVFGDVVLSAFGAEFASGALILAILLFAELCDGSFALVETPLAFAAPSVPPRLLAAALVLEAAAIALLSAIWGGEGAAFGFLLAVGALTVMRLYMLARRLHVKILNMQYIKPLLFSGALGMLFYGWRVSLEGDMGGGLLLLGFVSAVVVGVWVNWRFALPERDKVTLREARQKAA